ncbi:MAG: DUF2281 domain-containing protein [Rubrobacter sp.]|nr:DUF2281 domain-containing protein [Rubrobacter sp.]
MPVVKVNEAKHRIAELLAEAAKGGEVVIEAEDGNVFKLVPSERPKKRGFVGSGKGRIWVSEDFDAPLEDFDEYMR